MNDSDNVTSEMEMFLKIVNIVCHLIILHWSVIFSAICTYKPRVDKGLSLNVGETVHILEEYGGENGK